MQRPRYNAPFALLGLSLLVLLFCFFRFTHTKTHTRHKHKDSKLSGAECLREGGLEIFMIGSPSGESPSRIHHTEAD